jgi:hypothetical protein
MGDWPIVAFNKGSKLMSIKEAAAGGRLVRYCATAVLLVAIKA